MNRKASQLASVLINSLMVFSATGIPVQAEETESSTPTPSAESTASGTRDLAKEEQTFRQALDTDGYGEVGKYKVEKIKDHVYHMDEGTKALPGGATDSDGNMNNPSSIYFVESDNSILMVDLGNPASGEAETDAQIIVEAMTKGKNVDIVLTHSHGDHTGLARSKAVFSNVNVDNVYIGEPDYDSAKEAIQQFVDENKVKTLKDGDSFTVDGNTYTANIVSAHTNGSLMIQDKTHSVLFAGDTFGSGFIWLFWDTNNGNPIKALSAGITKAQALLNEMTTPESKPTILAGHRWQQFWDQNPQRPGEMSIQYFNDMQQVITGLTNGSTVSKDYSAGNFSGIELSSNGAKAKIDTMQKYVDTYLDQLNAMSQAYVYNASAKLSIDTVNNTAMPTFIIYPDGYISDEDAKKLLDDSGLTTIIDDHAAVAYVARPTDGKTFTANDLDGFKTIVKKIAVADNVKLIGIGNGATFINENLTPYMNFVSGLALIHGQAGDTPTTSVPTYINDEDPTAYINADKAVKTGETDGITTWQNPDSHYETVVVSTNTGTDAQLLQEAWDKLLRKYGRIGNYTEPDNDIVATWYTRPLITGDDAADQARKYQYFDSVDAIDNIERTVVTEDLNGNGINSLWYEYIPTQSKDAAKGTVPVVFLMHGNTNDPRTQYDTSGWANIASEEGIILVCPEWQGHTYQGYTYDPMTTDTNATPNADFIKVVKEVLAKYPQIDASRVYISGLSAGSRNTLNNGLANTSIFAAGAGHSGAWGINETNHDQLVKDIEANKDSYDFPIVFFTGDKDEYLRSDFDTLTDTMGLSTVQAYEELNNMPVTTTDDLTEENKALWGIPWDKTWTIDPTAENLCTIKGGLLTNANGVEIELNRIYGWGHWNYAPDARLMWDFMKKYARDPETGKTIRLDQKQDETKPTSEPAEEIKPTDDTKSDTNTAKTTIKGTSKKGAQTGVTKTNVGVFAGILTSALAIAGIALYMRKKHE